MWAPKEKQQTEVPVDTCGICGKAVEQEHKAMQCDMCEQWEHMMCVRVPDQVEDSLYEALTKCCSKAIMFCCVSCRKGGSLFKHMNKLQTECALINKQGLASTREREETQEALKQLRVDSKRERDELLAELKEMRHMLGASIHKAKGDKSPGVDNVVRDDLSSRISNESENSESDNRSDDNESHASRNHNSSVQPCGFKELYSRIDKFSGKSQEDDFEVWLEDIIEATNDCGWSDKQHAHWFSWFISGSAKSTWQRNLKPTDKSS